MVKWESERVDKHNYKKQGGQSDNQTKGEGPTTSW